MQPYHHGDLRAALLARAAEILATSSLDSLTFRGLARDLGVSHGAPLHHFGDRRGLLTALARQGFDELTQTLKLTVGDLYDKGVAYILWADNHRGHYAVMWEPSLLNQGDVGLSAAHAQAWEQLTGALPPGPERQLDSIAAFALVHGVAVLRTSGTQPATPDDSEGLRNLLLRLRPSPGLH